MPPAKPKKLTLKMVSKLVHPNAHIVEKHLSEDNLEPLQESSGEFEVEDDDGCHRKKALNVNRKELHKLKKKVKNKKLKKKLSKDDSESSEFSISDVSAEISRDFSAHHDDEESSEGECSEGGRKHHRHGQKKKHLHGVLKHTHSHHCDDKPHPTSTKGVSFANDAADFERKEFQIPWVEYNEDDVWWSEDDSHDARQDWFTMIEYFSNVPEAAKLADKVFKSAREEKMAEALRKLAEAYPDAVAVASHVSSKGWEATYHHRIAVLDTVDKMFETKSGMTEEDMEELRQASRESSRLPRRFAAVKAMEHVV